MYKVILARHLYIDLFFCHQRGIKKSLPLRGSHSYIKISGIKNHNHKNYGGKIVVKFETIKSEEIKFGTRNFLEIARKKAISETPEGGSQENEFISISRGFFTPDNQKRFRSSIAVPPDKDVVNSIATAIKKML